ncbi:LacI family DNA-binding transcriptional regulator [uncultured Aquimarina sp.]|uniref:LacI family DNA-binding transcriptional regulator n=1 Tax=uncultured Aquimarina sp. TaxID=575652 RepID=UPI002622C654|nr:LacI family DNA-binding transcriptional regulator [uncultured Aquimarina sp.]
MYKKKKVQLKDIAQEANVSVALVSYVLNGRHTNRIKPETAERIKEAAMRLNYQPNYFAKGLKTQKSYTIGLVLADLTNPFSTQITRAIENELNNHQYNILIGSTDENGDKLRNLIDVFRSRQVDGLIILPTENSEKVITELHESGFPYVLIDRYFRDTAFNFVVNDNYFTTFSATKRLIKRGKRKIGFITLKTNLFHISERKRGFIEACEEAGIDITDCIVEATLEQLDKEVRAGINNIKQKYSNLDALLFSTDNLMLCGLQYAIKYKLYVENRIELMAVDEARFYNIYPSPIQYYKQPLAEMGQKAVQFLMSKIEGNKSQTIQEIVKGKLVG